MMKEAFLHPLSLCESVNVGHGTQVFAFSHILSGAQIGKNCKIFNNVFIENDVSVGDEVTLKSGVQLLDGIRVGSRVFIGPNATFTNDLNPRSYVSSAKFLKTVIEDDASIGANATILPGIKIGRGASVGAGAVVTRDVPDFAKVVGNPARIIGYVSQNSFESGTVIESAIKFDIQPGDRQMLGVGGCYLEQLPHFSDLRGSLTPIELGKGLSFTPSRIFLVYGVDGSRIRGEHAHRVCAQFIVLVSGDVSIMLDDGDKRIDFRLDKLRRGLYLPPRVWSVQYNYSPDAVLMVVASHAYDDSDYIRDYREFVEFVRE